MPGAVWAAGAALVVLSGVIAHAMTRRYGRGTALALPLLALVVLVGMQWQEQDLTLAEGLRMAGSTAGLAAPVLLGVAAGIVLACLRRGKG
jgi:hypothetical protein